MTLSELQEAVDAAVKEHGGGIGVRLYVEEGGVGGGGGEVDCAATRCDVWNQLSFYING